MFFIFIVRAATFFPHIEFLIKYNYRISSSVGQKNTTLYCSSSSSSSSSREQLTLPWPTGMMNIPNVHFPHTAVPSFIAGPCSRGPLKRLSSPAIKREKLKIKEGGGWMAVREEEDKGSQLSLFPLHSTTAPNILTAQATLRIWLFLAERVGGWGETPTELWGFIKGNGQCHFPFPSSVRFGCSGLGLISTTWLQLERSLEWWGDWN